MPAILESITQYSTISSCFSFKSVVFCALTFTDDLKLHECWNVQFGFAKINGTKINLHTKLQTHSAAKLKGFTVRQTDWKYMAYCFL